MFSQCFTDPAVTFIPKKDFVIIQLLLLTKRCGLTDCDEGQRYVDRREDSNDERIATLEVVLRFDLRRCVSSAALHNYER